MDFLDRLEESNVDEDNNAIKGNYHHTPEHKQQTIIAPKVNTMINLPITRLGPFHISCFRDVNY